MSHVNIASASVTYSGVEHDVRALDALDLTLEPGEAVAIIGPSGCGKTTLLLAVAGLVALSTGTIAVDGRELTGPRLRTALILQDFGLLPWKDALHNAASGYFYHIHHGWHINVLYLGCTQNRLSQRMPGVAFNGCCSR